MSEVYCGQVSFHWLQYFLGYVFFPILVKSRQTTERHTTDDRQKVIHMSICKLHRISPADAFNRQICIQHLETRSLTMTWNEKKVNVTWFWPIELSTMFSDISCMVMVDDFILSQSNAVCGPLFSIQLTVRCEDFQWFYSSVQCDTFSPVISKWQN